MLCTRCLRAASLPLARNSFPTARRLYSSSTSPSTSNPSSASSSITAISSPSDPSDPSDPKLSTPISSPGEPPKPAPRAPRSICLEGTVLNGLNYQKGGQDPVALKDEEYPEWLWSCLDVMKKSSDSADADLGDEFSKSKKQRKLAMKRQRALEERLLAEGNLEALAPKIPLQQQSINLSGAENSTPEGNVAAAAERDALRKAMRKERKAKIKEANYLKSM